MTNNLSWPPQLSSAPARRGLAHDAIFSLFRTTENGVSDKTRQSDTGICYTERNKREHGRGRKGICNTGKKLVRKLLLIMLELHLVVSILFQMFNTLICNPNSQHTQLFLTVSLR